MSIKTNAYVMVAVLAGCTVCTTGAWGQQIPNKPIRLIVGFPPGGSNDIVARNLAPKLGELLGVQVIVENRAGANATIAAEFVTKSAPDGHTLFLGSTSSLVISPHTYSKMAYETLRDFAPVTTVAMTPEALAIHPSLPARDLKSLVALAKANPGKLDFASSGSGGLPHLALELFKTQANINLQHVPYKGAPQAVTDLLGGHVRLYFGSIPPLMQHVKAGRLRALGVSSAKRTHQVADLPTLSEAGVPGFEFYSWFGMLAPAKKPKPYLQRVHEVLMKAMRAPETVNQFEAQGADPVGNSPEEYTAFIKREYDTNARLVKAAGLRVE